MMYRLNNFDLTILVLLVVGGINWGLIGLLQFDLVASLFGTMSTLTRLVYSIVGFSACYVLYIIYKLKL